MDCNTIKPVTGACDRSVSLVGWFVIKRSVQNNDCHKCNLMDTPSHMGKTLSKDDIGDAMLSVRGQMGKPLVPKSKDQWVIFSFIT